MQRNESLFLKDALDRKKQPWVGNVRLATPFGQGVLTWISVATGLVIVGWLCVGHYSRRARVLGSLVPIGGIVDVAARSPSIVTRVRVQEGDHVHKGQPLFELSGERSSEALGETGSLVTIQLREQQGRLRAGVIEARNLAKVQSDGLRAQQQMLAAELEQFDAQLSITQKQVESYTTLLDKIRPLTTKGFVSQLQIQQQEAQTMEAQAQVKSLKRQRYATAQQLAQIGDQLAQLPMTTAEKVSELQGQLSQAQQALLQNEADRLTVVPAPSDGIMASVMVKPGQAVTSAQVMASVIPADSRLHAELLVPSSAVGFLRPNIPVSLHYQAFPYQKFGVAMGAVERVTHSALTPSEITMLTGEKAPDEPLYRVDVSLPRQTVAAYGRDEELRAGMVVDADLILDRRRLIEWVLEPLYGLRSERGAMQ
ncbi:HlyD family efflux transporter periplasmic adaptor subunit [Luteibacter sp. PPL201]|uniref:HlyD family efflux transporter periplasmic adaptor subunit n=1 Tax=Luteibacter sahnii TaxID=3021977 RepID=A0ABT6B9C1_9GAMM